MKIDSSNNTYNVQQNSLTQNQPTATNNKVVDAFESLAAQGKGLLSQIDQAALVAEVEGIIATMPEREGEIESFDFKAHTPPKKSFWQKLFGFVASIVTKILPIIMPALAPIIKIIEPAINFVAQQLGANDGNA